MPVKTATYAFACKLQTRSTYVKILRDIGETSKILEGLVLDAAPSRRVHLSQLHAVMLMGHAPFQYVDVKSQSVPLLKRDLRSFCKPVKNAAQATGIPPVQIFRKFEEPSRMQMLRLYYKTKLLDTSFKRRRFNVEERCSSTRPADTPFALFNRS
jgi:hypothetical protein